MFLNRVYLVLPSFTEFYRVLPSFTGFYPQFNSVSVVLNGCYWVFTGFSGFDSSSQHLGCDKNWWRHQVSSQSAIEDRSMAFDSIGPNWFEIGSIARQSNRPKENKKPKESDRSVALIRRVPIGQRKHAHSQHSQQQPISGDLWKSSFDRIKNRTAFHISKSISSRPVLFFLFFFFSSRQAPNWPSHQKKKTTTKQKTNGFWAVSRSGRPRGLHDTRRVTEFYRVFFCGFFFFYYYYFQTSADKRPECWAPSKTTSHRHRLPSFT